MDNKTPTQLTIQGFDTTKLSYGDHINHSDIDAWSQLECPDVSGMSISDQKEHIKKYSLDRLCAVEGLKKYLLEERLMYLQSVMGSGYRIVKPEEQTIASVEKGMRMVEKGFRHMRKGVDHVNVAMLSAPDREFNAITKAKIAGFSLMAGKKKDYIFIK